MRIGYLLMTLFVIKLDTIIMIEQKYQTLNRFKSVAFGCTIYFVKTQKNFTGQDIDMYSHVSWNITSINVYMYSLPWKF